MEHAKKRETRSRYYYVYMIILIMVIQSIRILQLIDYFFPPILVH